MLLTFVVQSMAVPKWKQTYQRKDHKKIIVRTNNVNNKHMNKKWSEIVLEKSKKTCCVGNNWKNKCKLIISLKLFGHLKILKSISMLRKLTFKKL